MCIAQGDTFDKLMRLLSPDVVEFSYRMYRYVVLYDRQHSLVSYVEYAEYVQSPLLLVDDSNNSP